MYKKFLAFASIIIFASMLLSACQPAAPGSADQPAAEETKVLHMSLGIGDVPTIDPALTTDSSSIQVVDETTVGLTRQNEITTLDEPAMATSWDISGNGKVYTFHLRSDVPWVTYDYDTQSVAKVQDCEGNDRMVNAHDFAYGVIRTLNPETASDYAYVLDVIKGATDFNQSITDDPATVGVKAVDDYTLEFTFNDAAAYNLSIVSMWVAHAQPKWLIEGDDCSDPRGDRWTETGFFQGYGPYVMKEWVHDASITIVQNPFWPTDMESVPTPKISEVIFTFLDDPASFADYEAGNNDVSKVPLADMDRVKTDPVLSKELTISPDMSTYYYGFNTAKPFIDDVRVRRALSMAIDRQALIDNVLKGGQEAAQWISRPGLAGAPTMENYADLGVKYNPEAAKQSLQEYLDEKGITADQIDITLMFNTNAGHQRIAETIQAMWKDTLGIEAKLTNQEWKVFLKTIKGEDAPQVYRSGWSMDYTDANNFTRNLFSWGGNDNPGPGGLNWKNEQFETLVKEAAVEPDPAKRVELYAQAEQILVYDDAVVIPLYWYTRVNVTKPYVERTMSVLGNLERIEKWDMKAK